MGYKVTGLAKRIRERNLRRSYSRTMELYENVLDVMVNQDPRTTNPNKEVERDSTSEVEKYIGSNVLMMNVITELLS